MSRKIEIGDIAEVKTEDKSRIYIIKEVFYDRIAIVTIESISTISHIIAKDGIYQVENLSLPHTILFRVSPILIASDYIRNIIDLGKEDERSKFNGMTEEQLLESPFVGIIHGTNIKALRSIIRSGKIEKSIELNRGSIYNQHQFPGIYTNIWTQEYFSSLSDTSRLPFVYIILSLALLQQQNWHFNAIDQYGIINNMTLTSRTLPKYISKIDRFWTKNIGKLSELVFHDAIPTYFIEAILVNTDVQKDQVLEIVGDQIPIITRSMKKVLAQSKFIKGINNYRLLDNSLPQYCYSGVMGDDTGEIISKEDVVGYNERFNPYTQEEKEIAKNEKENDYVWRKRLKMCNIEEEYERDKETELLKKIEDKMEGIYYGKRERIIIKEEDNAPWKYIPSYYGI